MEITEATPKRPTSRKKVLVWALIATFVLALGGLITWQASFRTAVAETSYNSVYDVWGGDPRTICTNEGERAWSCKRATNIAPTDTERFYAGKCDGSTSDMPGSIMLDLPVGMLDKVDPLLGGTEGDEPGSIQVTYRPKVLGFIGNDRVLKITLRSSGVHCGDPVSSY